MRGSPFQERSALVSIEQNENYLRHRQRVTDIATSPRVVPDSTPIKEFTARLKKPARIYAL